LSRCCQNPYLRREGLTLPTRPLRGPAPHEIAWAEPTSDAILKILKNPSYAGAYVYGRCAREATRRKPGAARGGVVRRPIDKWAVCLKDVYPAYISWDEYLANQQRLRSNRTARAADIPGAARKGRALLQGIVLCGICGLRLTLRYSGPRLDYPVYECSQVKSTRGDRLCQHVRAPTLDAEVERLVLEALEPDRIALALSALEQLEREDDALERQWRLRIERARYEAARAERQYGAIEPEHRLVARSLERQWEEKLRGVEQIEREYEDWRSAHQILLTASDREQILALGQDLPRVWNAETTTNVDRKQIVRLVIKHVVVDQRRERGKVWLRIVWQTGATSEQCIRRNTVSYREHADAEALERRVRELNAEGKTDKQITAILNSEGYRTIKGGALRESSVVHMRQTWGVEALRQSNGGYNPHRWSDGTYSIQGVAALVDVDPSTVGLWCRERRIEAWQPTPEGAWRIPLTEDQIRELRASVRRVRRRPRPSPQ
jgi:hypothetical protein